MKNLGPSLKGTHFRIGITLLVAVTTSVGCGRGGGKLLTIPPCAKPKLDMKSWEPVQERHFRFRLPPGFREVKIQGIDTVVRIFRSADSSVSLTFDWGAYSDPLPVRGPEWVACEERIGGRKGRIVTMPYSDPDSDPRGAIILGAGVAWRDITPGVHLTMFGWAREPSGLDQLLGIFRTVRFEGSGRK